MGPNLSGISPFREHGGGSPNLLRRQNLASVVIRAYDGLEISAQRFPDSFSDERAFTGLMINKRREQTGKILTSDMLHAAPGPMRVTIQISTLDKGPAGDRSWRNIEISDLGIPTAPLVAHLHRQAQYLANSTYRDPHITDPQVRNMLVEQAEALEFAGSFLSDNSEPSILTPEYPDYGAIVEWYVDRINNKTGQTDRKTTRRVAERLLLSPILRIPG